MTSHTANNDANFDPIARPYRWLEYLTFGRSLERCRNHFIPQLAECRSALVMGDGDGRFVASLLTANTQIETHAVDTSAAMLRLLTRGVAGIASDASTRLRTHTISALKFLPNRRYDLVVTHFFLDCLTQIEVDHLCTRIATCLPSAALWLVSDFRIPNGLMHWPARALIRTLYIAFRFLTGLRVTRLADPGPALSAAGFALIAHHHFAGGLLTTQLWRRREYTADMLPAQHLKSRSVADPLPNPEPASPSLPGPDPGVFHHEPGVEPPQPQSPPPATE